MSVKKFVTREIKIFPMQDKREISLTRQNITYKIYPINFSKQINMKNMVNIVVTS